MQIRKEYVIGAATLLVGSIAYGVFTKNPKQLLQAVVPEVDTRLAIRKERPAAAVQPARNFFENWEISRAPAIVPSGQEAPYRAPHFGKDMQRNSENVDESLDTYLALPLEGDGKTHVNRNLWKELEEEGGEKGPEEFTFIRLEILETRDAAAAQVAIGGLKLFNGTDLVYHPETKRWNPYTGERSAYVPEAAWSDSDQKVLILKFPSPVAITRYSIRTSNLDTGFDPVWWRLEGSRNGVYWLRLDERETEALPLERGVWTALSLTSA